MTRTSKLELKEQLAETGERSAELRITAARLDGIADSWGELGRPSKLDRFAHVMNDEPSIPNYSMQCSRATYQDAEQEARAVARDLRAAGDRLEALVARLRSERDERELVRERDQGLHADA